MQRIFCFTCAEPTEARQPCCPDKRWQMICQHLGYNGGVARTCGPFSDGRENGQRIRRVPRGSAQKGKPMELDQLAKELRERQISQERWKESEMSEADFRKIILELSDE